MSELTRYHYEKLADQLQQIAESIEDHLAPSTEDIKRKIKNQNQSAGRKYAREIGLAPNEKLEDLIRTIINDKIIDEVKLRKLKHADIASSIKGSRPKITALMNRKSKGITIDFMLRVLSILGVSAQISFD